jgi:DNA (cytosine-5)-methyltransferase 1
MLAINVARPLSVLSLCSGVGMLDLGLGAAFDARTVCYVEREAFAASQLVALMEAGLLDAAPVWSDLSTFDARPWRGRVDCLIAGLPCQPYSAAGKQEGNEDRRSWGEGDGPIPHALRIIAECRPAVVFLENVTAWVVGGFFRPVGEELCRLGYELERPQSSSLRATLALRISVIACSSWPTTTAGDSDPPAPRTTRRTAGAFGDDADGRAREWQTPTAGREAGRTRGSSAAGVEDAARHGGRSIGPHAARRGTLTTARKLGEPKTRGLGHERSGSARRMAGWIFGRWRYMAEPDGAGSQGGGRDDREEGRQEPDGHAGLAGGSLFAPGPLDPRWPRIIADHPHLAPATEPGVRGVAHGFAWLVDESRRHQLRAIGNGAVPLCFAVAITLLLGERSSGTSQ